MLTTFSGGANRLWYYTTDPDSSVHNDEGAYSDQGEIFLNTTTNKLFFCVVGGMDQSWIEFCYLSDAESLFDSILQSNWTQATTSAQDYIKNKPSLAAVATSGSYSDLSSKPTIPAAQVQSNWTEANTSALDFILNKPTLATVATTGSYTDLSSKPTIPAAQIQSDWTQASSGSLDFIKNKPILSTVATTGNYSDLSGKPTLATVATSGSYTDLSNKPSIPSTQIQSDWTQTTTSSLDYIKNKPAVRSQSSASRSLNSAFQVSATRDSFVNYSVDIATSFTLTAGQVGTVYVDISTSSGFGTFQELGRFVNGQTGVLLIGVSINQTATGTIGGFVPAGYYCRIRTENTTGTPTFTYRSGQETLL